MKLHYSALALVSLTLLAFNLSAATLYVSLNSTNPVSPYADWSTAATNIQNAVDASTNGDLIWVTNGLYAAGGRVVYGSLTNRVAIDKAVTVQSVSGPAVTIIAGYRIPSGATNFDSDVRCVYMTNNAVLNGFTITGGATLSMVEGGTTSFARSQLTGGGVFCESTNSVLTNCVLAGNLCASGSSGGGGAVYQGTLNDCILSNNLALSYGAPGGAAFESVLNDCLIVNNSASFGGGAASSTLNHCTVIGNSAPYFGSTSWGGGTYMCTANHCLITGNYSATSGGGDCMGILSFCILSNNACVTPYPNGGHGGGSVQGSPNGSYISMLYNCLVVSNYCNGSGGGVYFEGSVPVFLTNCTIVGNTATNQGGGAYNGGTLENCIIYGNYPPSGFGFGSPTLISCWTNDPLFANPAGGDYHLQSNSPCINSGNNAYVTSAVDLDGNSRIVGGTVDIGAYEYQTPASVISYAWLQQYGLPPDGSADYLDSDIPTGDGMNNYQEWIAGTNPTNALSVLKMLNPVPTNSPVGLVVSWESVSNRTYFLQSCTNIGTQRAFTTIQSNILGQPDTTSFTDTTATNAGPYFYRVGVQQ